MLRSMQLVCKWEMNPASLAMGVSAVPFYYVTFLTKSQVFQVSDQNILTEMTTSGEFHRFY